MTEHSLENSLKFSIDQKYQLFENEVTNNSETILTQNLSLSQSFNKKGKKKNQAQQQPLTQSESKLDGILKSADMIVKAIYCQSLIQIVTSIFISIAIIFVLTVYGTQKCDSIKTWFVFYLFSNGLTTVVNVITWNLRYKTQVKQSESITYFQKISTPISCLLNVFLFCLIFYGTDLLLNKDIKCKHEQVEEVFSLTIIIFYLNIMQVLCFICISGYLIVKNQFFNEQTQSRETKNIEEVKK